MDTSTQAQAEQWAHATEPTFVSDTERDAYNEMRGIFLQHPAEIAARGEWRRIRELLDIIEREQANA